MALTIGAAEDLRVTPADLLVRDGRPFSVTIQWRGLPVPGSGTLTLDLTDATGSLGQAVVPLASGDQLAWPAQVAVIPERPAGAQLHLTATLVVADRERGRTEVSLVAPGTLVPPAGDGLAARLSRSLLAEGEAISLADYARFQRGFGGWQSVIDPVDGSLQPVRIHRLSGAKRVFILAAGLVDDDRGPGARWPEVPSAWLTAAAAAGVDVVEVFPGGDTTWSGPAARRIPLAAALVPGLPVTVLALGPVPATTFPVMTAKPAELADPVTWQRLGVPAPPVPAVPPLMAWATGPVTVVVGTGEHRAAQEDNTALAGYLAKAWWNWARGVLPTRLDTEDLPPTGNVVLIGSPRSNRRLAELVPTCPLTWTDRTISVGDRVLLRPKSPAIAWAGPRPGVPGAWILVLDGTWRWGDLPLPAGDLAIQE